VARVEQEIADPAFIVLVAETAGDLIDFAISVTVKRRIARHLCQVGRMG
jgi:hypothetical protein